MGFFDFLAKWFGSKQETPQPKQEQKQNNMKKKAEKYSVDDKSFHPEILFLINRPYAEYVDFIEVK